MFKAVTVPIVGFVVAVGIGSLDPARAQHFKYDTAIDALEAQCMVTHRMVAEAMLVALEFEADNNVARLSRSREQFDMTLRRFRDGNGEIGARVSANPEIVEQVDLAEDLWQSLDAAIGNHVTAAPTTAEHIETIAELGQSLHEALGDLAEGMRHSAGAGAHGMLSNAIEAAVRAETLSQQMTKEFLFVAYGYQADRHRFALRGSAEQFNLVLQGLIQGDIDQRLLPAPTQEIRTQLLTVERIWREQYRPLIDLAIDFKEIDEDTLARVAQANLLLFREIETAAGMYREL